MESVPDLAIVDVTAVLISMRRRRAPQNFDSKWKWWSSWYAA
jgi:hypothetical protein